MLAAEIKEPRRGPDEDASGDALIAVILSPSRPLAIFGIVLRRTVFNKRQLARQKRERERERKNVEATRGSLPAEIFAPLHGCLVVARYTLPRHRE